MNQSRVVSAIEAGVNIVIGFLVSYLGTFFIYPVFGMQSNATIYFGVTVAFTILSFIRIYVVRRWFNGPFHLWLEKRIGNANKNRS